MKGVLFKLYESILEEDFNYNLYHFTTMDKLKSILIDKKIKGNTDPKVSGSRIFKQHGYPSEGISTTRDKNLHWTGTNVRIVLDKRKLKNRFKIIPLHWFNMRYNVQGVNYRGWGNKKLTNKEIPMNQAEERVITQKGIPIDYIEKIELINNPQSKPLTQQDITTIKGFAQNIPVVDNR